MEDILSFSPRNLALFPKHVLITWLIEMLSAYQWAHTFTPFELKSSTKSTCFLFTGTKTTDTYFWHGSTSQLISLVVLEIKWNIMFKLIFADFFCFLKCLCTLTSYGSRTYSSIIRHCKQNSSYLIIYILVYCTYSVLYKNIQYTYINYFVAKSSYNSYNCTSMDWSPFYEWK